MKLFTDEILKKCRTFNVKDGLAALQYKRFKFICWGAENFTNYQDKALVFKVNGHNHKGLVVLTVNGLDYYDVYLLNNKKEIIKEINDIFCEDLCDIVDREVEYVEAYGNN